MKSFKKVNIRVKLHFANLKLLLRQIYKTKTFQIAKAKFKNTIQKTTIIILKHAVYKVLNY